MNIDNVKIQRNPFKLKIGLDNIVKLNLSLVKKQRQVLSKCVFVELLTEIEVIGETQTQRRVLS